MLRPHFPTPIAALALVFAAWVVTGSLALLQLDPGDARPQLDPGLTGIAQVIGFGLIATLAARRVPGPQGERLGLSPLALRFIPLVAMGVPFALVASEIDNWLSMAFPTADPEAIQRQLEAMRGMTPLAVTQVAIVAIGLEPVVTEFLFRGVIQQGLISYLGRFTGVLVTAALSLNLASLIASNGSPVSATLLSLMLGLSLGYLRIATGSLLAPILVRATWNGLGLFGVVYAEQFPVAGFNTTGDHVHPILFTACAACVVWGAIELMRALRDRPLVLPIEEDPEPEEDDEGAGFF